MKELNCLGDMCPLPIMKLRDCKTLNNKGGQVKLITDHSCVVESVTDYCKKSRLALMVTEPMNGVWELFIEHP